MNKKGSTAVIVSVILIALVILGFITILIITLKNPSNKTEITETLSLYLESRDSLTNQQIESEYVVITEKGILLSQGKLDKDSLLEIKNIPKEERLYIYCLGDHYTSRNQKNITQVEKDNNASKFTCLQDPLGNLKVTHAGDLNSTDNLIRFNISSNSFKGLSAVVSWSSGIVNVEFRDNQIECNQWINFTFYNNETKEYLYLPEKNYICQDKIRECDKIQENKCILKEIIPDRYKGKVDIAFSTGRDLKNETYELFLYVKTDEVKIPSDFIEIRFYDKDIVHLGNGQFQYLSEFQGKNIGSGDLVYRINYQQ